MIGSRTVRASRGVELAAKSWQTEAPLRMLMNNLDPEVAEQRGVRIPMLEAARAAAEPDTASKTPAVAAQGV